LNIITIGDLHGSEAWRQVKPTIWDIIVFVGDYVDSFEFEDAHILRNLEQVIRFKKKNPAKVVLLLGNHDLAYWFNGERPHLCSGFRRRMLPVLQQLFYREAGLFQAAFQVDNYLWTHAGVVNRWYQNYPEPEIQPSDVNLAFTLNRLFSSYYLPLFHVSPVRGGLDNDGGIFWAHSTETSEDPLPGFHQIIGHTKTHKGIMSQKLPLPDTSVTYVDCLETRIEFHELHIH
jgi:hypothetical protein